MTSKKRVLIVDDDRDIVALVTTMAEIEGYEARSAANGAEALSLLKRGEYQPDLILLDLMMPVMDGWTFSREARQLAEIRRTPIVVISSTHDLQRKVEGLPIEGFIQKPFDYDQLRVWFERAADAG